jgi:hypothetical protein
MKRAASRGTWSVCTLTRTKEKATQLRGTCDDIVIADVHVQTEDKDVDVRNIL